jgi:hypothetical protein
VSGRVVIDLVGDPVDGRLAESALIEKRFAYGGEVSAIGLAFAAAENGHPTELRGWIDRRTFDQFKRHTRATPRVELPARAPEAGDFVIVPEGWSDPLPYLQLALSPARLAIHLMAAPGLFGWSFDGDGPRPDPVTVPLEDLARREHLEGMRALGFELVTHSEGLAELAASLGIECTYTGVGEPWPPREARAGKSVDVIALMNNRWAPLARRVLDDLPDLEVDRVSAVTNSEMLRRMARARVLVWPSRVEGHARIPVEARSVGCVPVALSTNRFAALLDEEHGAVVVDTVEEIPGTVRALLGDEARLARLAKRGPHAAAEITDWPAHVERVGAFLEAPAPPDLGRAARAGAGAAARAAVRRLRADHQYSFEERVAQVEVARGELTAAALAQERLAREIERLTGSKAARTVARARRLAAEARGRRG